MYIIFFLFIACENASVKKSSSSKVLSSTESEVISWDHPILVSPQYQEGDFQVITSIEDSTTTPSSIPDFVVLAPTGNVPDNYIQPPEGQGCHPFDHVILRKNNGFDTNNVYTGFMVDEIYIWNVHRYPISLNFSTLKTLNQEKVANYLTYSAKVFNSKENIQNQIDSSVYNLLPGNEPFIKIILISGEYISENEGPLVYEQGAPVNNYLLTGTQWQVEVKSFQKNISSPLYHTENLPADTLCHQENLFLKKIKIDFGKSSLDGSSHKVQFCLKADDCLKSDLKVTRKTVGSFQQQGLIIPSSLDTDQFCSYGYLGNYYEIFTPTNAQGNFLELSCEGKDNLAYKNYLRIDRGTKRGR